MRTLARALATGPNLITLSRLGLVACAAIAFFADAVVLALCFGAGAGVTDYADGWLARRTGQVTRLGEILDQFCDVALETTLLVMAVTLRALPVAMIVPYVLREVGVACVRRHAIELGQNIPSRLSGKLKSAFLGWSCLPLFLGITHAAGAASPALLRLGQLGVGAGIALSVVSGVGYTMDFSTIYQRFAVRPETQGGPGLQEPPGAARFSPPEMGGPPISVAESHRAQET